MVFGPGEGASGDGFAGVVEIDVALVEKEVNVALVGQMDDALEVLAETTEPAGLDGELRMMALVRGVMAFSMASAVMRKLSASLVSRKTTLPPAYWMMSLKLTQ